MSSISKLSTARKALASARTLDDILQIRDSAEAVRVYAKAAKEGLEAQNFASEIKIRAERKAGELLAGMEMQNGSRGAGKKVESQGATPLSDLGVNKSQSSRWQKEATVSDDEFERHVTECNDEQKELTQSSVLKLAGAGHVSQATGENEWYTPAEYIEKARQVLGKITLDPASSEHAQKTVKAKRFFTIADDGLLKKWSGSVWLNPPYSKDCISAFASKIAGHCERLEVKQAIVLVNNATETKWFQEMAAAASAMCFPGGRIRFNDKTGTPANSPLQGQAFIYFGADASLFHRVFSDVGFVVNCRADREVLATD
jgi:ParB family chromosome partitioning protein